jgi:hypothetical protein
VIAWEVLNPGLQALFKRLAFDLPGGAADGQALTVEHKDRPRAIMSDQLKRTLAMRVLSVTGFGPDEERQSYDSATNKLATMVTGQRRIRLQLECDSADNSDTGWAWATIERIRTRLHRTTSHNALQALESSLFSVGQAIEANFKQGGRIYNRVLLEVNLGAVVNDIELDQTNWIQYVVLTSHVNDADGVELPAPPNVVNLEIPTIP